MLNGRANDIKKHKWFEGLDWESLEARKITPLRKPKEDSAKRLKELTVSVTAQPCIFVLCSAVCPNAMIALGLACVCSTYCRNLGCVANM